jgi:uncharacterized protein YcbK (DUF882 family)
MMTRRTLLRFFLAAALLSPFGDGEAALKRSTEKAARVLSLYNTHTGESLSIRFSGARIKDPEAVEQISNLLRCHYTGEVRPIEPALLNLLCSIRDAAGAPGPVHIISGYRSPEYNEHLRSQGRKVARDSYHLEGLAIDFFVPGVKTGKIAKLARSHGAGGVGRYPCFVHIDLGPVRSW